MDKIQTEVPSEEAAQPAAEEKRQLLSRLLARFAHEIRNPISSLDIHVQLLDEDLVRMAPETREKLSGRLEIIRSELQRLENIVRQFLRLAGPSALDLAPVEIDRVIGHICGLLHPEAAAHEIEIVRSVADHLPAVSADRAQLVQALLNLLLNALQAVGQNGRVEVRARQAEDGLVIEVADTGPGVAPEQLGMIFEPYFTTRPGGTGLGLWIAQQIITAHNGMIKAANAPGGGAVFTVRLPLRHGEHPHEPVKN